MDDSEKLVEAYLRGRGYTTVYEPDGNIPPDFAVDGAIGVEVRRLNQNHHDGTRTRGLEETAIPVWQRMRKLIETYGPSVPGMQSWYIFYRFTRPIPAWKDLSVRVANALDSLPAVAAKPKYSFDLGDGFELTAHASKLSLPWRFRHFGHSDDQSGGFLIEEIEANLKLCIAEKLKKIAPYRIKYREWWLILPDHIGFGLDEFDQQIFRSEVKLTLGFDRVILLDPRNSSRCFEL